jgi:hypothetical protein
MLACSLLLLKSVEKMLQAIEFESKLGLFRSIP